jgi:hypothetical protein
VPDRSRSGRLYKPPANCQQPANKTKLANFESMQTCVLALYPLRMRSSLIIIVQNIKKYVSGTIINLNIKQHKPTQANTSQHKPTQANTSQHKSTQVNTSQYTSTQINTSQHRSTQANTSQHKPTQANTSQHKPT